MRELISERCYFSFLYEFDYFSLSGIEFDYNPDDDSEPDLARYGFHVDFNDQQELTRYQKWLKLRPKIWSLFDDPSSKPAKVCLKPF